MAKSGRRSRSRNQSRSQQSKRQRQSQRQGQKRRGTRKINKFMVAKEKARKSKQAEFNYKGNTYVRGTASTGMVIYSRK
jgi:hypothetical protein